MTSLPTVPHVKRTNRFPDPFLLAAALLTIGLLILCSGLYLLRKAVRYCFTEEL